MIYIKNLPLWERLLRIGVGMVVAAYAAVSVGGVLGWAIAAGGIGAALTGIVGFCPACALAGRRLKQRAPRDQTVR